MTAIRKPDYRFKYRGEYHEGFYNNNVDVYNIFHKGNYKCTAYVPNGAPQSKVIKRAMEVNKTLYDIPFDEWEIKLTMRM